MQTACCSVYGATTPHALQRINVKRNLELPHAGVQFFDQVHLYCHKKYIDRGKQSDVLKSAHFKLSFFFTNASTSAACIEKKCWHQRRY